MKRRNLSMASDSDLIEEAPWPMTQERQCHNCTGCSCSLYIFAQTHKGYKTAHVCSRCRELLSLQDFAVNCFSQRISSQFTGADPLREPRLVPRCSASPTASKLVRLREWGQRRKAAALAKNLLGAAIWVGLQFCHRPAVDHETLDEGVDRCERLALQWFALAIWCSRASSLDSLAASWSPE